MKFKPLTFPTSVALHDSRGLRQPFHRKELERRGLSDKEIREYYQAF